MKHGHERIQGGNLGVKEFARGFEKTLLKKFLVTLLVLGTNYYNKIQNTVSEKNPHNYEEIFTFFVKQIE